mmetsp:Transcript_1921/g.1720  ORF Transcript_1921/g.1720 Transcript_1921/m.1720 type:complete len:118 (+) Transcript_1921:1029-1382(+)
MKFLTKVLLNDEQRMYIRSYDPNRLLKAESIEKTTLLRKTTIQDELINHMPSNLSGNKHKLNFSNIIDKFFDKKKETKLSEMDQKILGEIVDNISEPEEEISKNLNQDFMDKNQTWA